MNEGKRKEANEERSQRNEANEPKLADVAKQGKLIAG